MPQTGAEVRGYIAEVKEANKIFDDVAKMDLNVVDDKIIAQLDEAAKVRDNALSKLNQAVDKIDPRNLFPNIPFKDQKDWVSTLIKNDLSIAAKNRFYFDENGVLQVNKSAPSHYTVSPSEIVKERWMGSSSKLGMNIPPNMRVQPDHGKAVAYDLEYGGPNIHTHQVIDESKAVTDTQHFTGNAEEVLRKLASEKNASFEIGKIDFGKANMTDSYIIELTPEMLTPYVQYFKHGGLVESIPQYNPLRSVLDTLGPIGAY